VTLPTRDAGALVLSIERPDGNKWFRVAVYAAIQSPHEIESRSTDRRGFAGSHAAPHAGGTVECVFRALSTDDVAPTGRRGTAIATGCKTFMRTNGPGQSALLLLDVVDLLSAEKVGYAVIGAMAASVHGVVRASLDADAVLSLSPLELGDLERRCKSAGFRTSLRYGDDDDPISALLEISDAHGNRVDLLSGLRGLERKAFSRAVDVPFHGATLRVASLEDFVAMKLFAGGPQDIDDARRALEIAGKDIDTVLLKRIVERYGRDAMEALTNLRRV